MTNSYNIPIYRPHLIGNEQKYVKQCLNSNWISSQGSFVNKFEQSFSEFIGCKYASAVANGTVALHVALEALGITHGDEVIVPTFTYVASVNTIIQTGATPIFVECNEDTLQVDPLSIERKIIDKTRAIMVVNLYGHPCDMKKISELCSTYKLLLIEDCAEALGTKIGAQHVGTYGNIATFSFFGNKTITTGEGGMVVSSDCSVIKKVDSLKNQGVSQTLQYWHDRLGYNYRMTNICAAIGLAQLENIIHILEKKRQIAQFYQENLVDLPLRHHLEKQGTTHSYWMCSIILNYPDDREPLRKNLQMAGIETRPFFYPVNQFNHCKTKEVFSISDKISKCGINLPSFPGITTRELYNVCDTIKFFFIGR